MIANLYWIEGPWPGRLAVSARPRGADWLEDEIKAWRAAGIDTVVSLLTADELDDMDLQQEKVLAEKHGIHFLSLPIVDRNVPALDRVTTQALERVEDELSLGKNVNVHCRQGVGRSGLIAASLLVARGMAPATAVKRVSEARGVDVPETLQQRTWIDAFASTLSAAGQQLRR